MSEHRLYNTSLVDNLWCALLLAAMTIAQVGCGSGEITAGDSEQAEEGTEQNETQETTNWEWPTCPSQDEAATLLQKAAGYDASARDLHLQDGLLRTATLIDPEGGFTDANTDFLHHSDNANYWTGLYAAGQMYRYLATQEAEALENAINSLRGLRDLQKVTGVVGLWGRCYATPEDLYHEGAENDPEWRQATASGYEGWRFKSDVSKDGMTGVMYAYAIALTLMEDEQILELAREGAHDFARHLYANGLRIIDVDGELTEHGALFPSAADEYPGFNALLAASFIRTGALAGSDEELNDWYEDCLMAEAQGECRLFDDLFTASYLELIQERLHLYSPGCQENYNNHLMAFLAMHALLMVEKDSDLLSGFRQASMRSMWMWEDQERDVADQGNSLFTFLYGAGIRPYPFDEVFAQAIEDALCTLEGFPASKVNRSIGAGDPADGVCTSRGGRPMAPEPYPIQQRGIDNFVWRLNPFEVPNAQEGSPTLVWSPEDYLLAYWLGRWAGYIHPED